MSFTSPRFQELVNQCIHCGLCLPACPTYDVFGTEMDAPRGRIAMMRAAADGRISLQQDGHLNQSFVRHIDLCLACRACETACPSGVKYGQLVETARIVIEGERQHGPVARFLRWLALRQLLPHRGRLRLLAFLLWLYQASRLQALVRALNFLPQPLKTMEEMLPELSAGHPDYRQPAPAIGQEHGRVALFLGCVQDAFLSPTNQATVRVLQRNGYGVHFPLDQTCCGAAQLHVGDENLARELARRNIDAFLAGDYQAVVVNAGGCGATLKEYAHLLADDPVYADRARRFVALVRDANEFVAAHLHNPPQGRLEARVTYSDSCHLRHAQKVVQPPRQLLRAIPGLELVELRAPDRCCGSAGVYNILQNETAEQILQAKMADITAALGLDGGNPPDDRPRIIVASNTGCHMQLIHGARAAGLDVPVRHIMDLLDAAYAAGGGEGGA
ncbi:MAG: heterodisulfide reductase-related iron-sulfur binding cluster [Anaerolineae bacterium]